MFTSKNNNLHAAESAKNDEFYTMYSDIENELRYYKTDFNNKVIYCNCDNAEESNFVKYFIDNFEKLGLKKLIATHYNPNANEFFGNETIYKTEVTNEGTVKSPLPCNGDFRSPECITILKEANIVVTNPPFSLFREYVALLMEHKKKFIVVGSQNAITYKETFKLIKENKLWVGNTLAKEFLTPEGTIKKFGNIGWFTNVNFKRRSDTITLFKKYKGNTADYPKYDNYNAINIDKVVDIPVDYKGAMGVPITFLNKYNPEQFEILGIDRYIKGNTTPNKRFNINGVEKYARIIIKRK